MNSPLIDSSLPQGLDTMAASKEVKLEEAFDVLCNFAQKLADEGGLNHMLCLPSDASPEEVMSASLGFADLVFKFSWHLDGTSKRGTLISVILQSMSQMWAHW
jgi:hypothetical protein